jgi:hypothetical protein
MRRFPNFEKTYSSEARDRVKQALEQIGEIKPWFDKDVDAWVFEHPDFPESYAGDSEAEVIKGYPYYLAQMFEEQIKGNLAPQVEGKIHMRGGKRPGAGRPVGTKKEPKTRIYVPTRLLKEVQAFIAERA